MSGTPMSGTPKNDPIVQYVVVRRDLITDLKWPMGAVITQACHASLAAVAETLTDPAVQQYLSDLDRMHKVVVEIGNENDLRQLSNALCEKAIPHKLWIEQPENIATCLASKPALKTEISDHFKRLKLFK
ncbi:unnamed protein product [Vitrella brassicaformis CCMP3155]|uniref:peptidyl-tRNA hydrolase n=1 Tax=Vitrella brassicaformis (strain CCMP3155) TaxID=1169540 RepID=A0A0G4FMC1_VITBC|nr:unnamed protein product [Vitrella brassicaformis CCMP3155]|eukprot:CEM14995.1 unnamed protein product [Vitrella brassicaformis CCMP3155]